VGGREPSRPHPLRPATRDALAGTRETATNHHAQSDALLVADHRKCNRSSGSVDSKSNGGRENPGGIGIHVVGRAGLEPATDGL
jgi:hypothetical protein